MKHIRSTRSLVLACFGLGVLLFISLHLWHGITAFLQSIKKTTAPQIQPVSHKKASLFFWHNNRWASETNDIMWPSTPDKQIYNLITAWLTFLDEEEFVTKKISLQSVLLAHNNHEAFISFDQSPFNVNDTTYEKWCWVESLLKTIRDNDVAVNAVSLLVQHEHLNDRHLHLAMPWPLCGFFHDSTE